MRFLEPYVIVFYYIFALVYYKLAYILGLLGGYNLHFLKKYSLLILFKRFNILVKAIIFSIDKIKYTLPYLI